MNLNQITLPSNNIPASRKFYLDLGFTLIVDSEHYLRFWCEDGDATFSLHFKENIQTESSAVIYFECNDLEKRYSDFVASGIKFLTKPTLQSWLWNEARLFDPSGNQICLYHAGENRKHPPWAVSISKDKT